MRFLVVVVTLWIGGRAAMLTWPDAAAEAEDIAPVREATQTRAPTSTPDAALLSATPPLTGPSIDSLPVRMAARDTGRGFPGFARAELAANDRGSRPAAIFPVSAPAPPADGAACREGGLSAAPNGTGAVIATPAPQFPAGPARDPAVPPSNGRRWSGSAFLYGRGGGNGAVPLAGGGQLGASQAGARIAWRIDDAGRIAAAARIYAPVDSLRGSEAAVGIDLHPLPAAPLRVSVERRIALGREGRDAWSAYAAGGFFRGIGRAVEVDGYAQAGIVGMQARDLFADGALRAARRFDLGGNRAVLAGAGIWAAAQPGAERVDAGPRVALRLPAGTTTISIAGEWRARVAGSARPRSGPALTIAADF